ncbi:hypothetical protein Clacol_006447 [Clathrus columnatus]|uniref:Protein CMS1 n=1 Tax=Clathrus columnatus TaxID=1419009 RepID=A0AAV5AGW3_9AGAM|nr:hypothetical protein Clacol_006447 [Clathrus columnatus]
MLTGDDLEDDYIPDDDIFSDQEEEFQPTFKEDQHTPEGDSVLLKKRKRREKEKEKRIKKRKLADSLQSEDTKSPSTFQLSSPEFAATYLSLQQKSVYNKLSFLELEDLKIPESCILNSTSYSDPRTLDNLGNFIEKCTPRLMIRLKQQSKFNGAPTLIFIAGAALRVADITRILRKFKGEKGGDVAKLFAKHLKLQDHITYLRRTKVGVAVGTPGRLGQLLEAEALTLPALTHIFLDVSFQDAKKRTIFDIPEIREEIFRGVLCRENILSALKSGQIQLVLF